MALKLNKEINNTGINAEYFKINEVLVNKQANEDILYVQLYIFKDAESRNSGKDPIDVQNVYIKSSQVRDSILALIYSEVKNMNEFEGAIDV